MRNIQMKSNKGISLIILIIAIIAVVAVLSVIIVVCLNSKDTNTNTNNILNDDRTINKTENNESLVNNTYSNSQNNNSSSETKNVKTTSVPGKNIYIDYDASMRKKDEAYTVIMYNTNDYLVGLSFKKDINYTGSLENVIELFKTDFINDASLSSRGDLYGSEIKVTNSTKAKVAGFDSIHFEGTVLNKNTWNCHVYGYSFIIDGVPCAVIGIVSAQSQDSTMITEVDSQVDNIANTIRTTE